MEKARLKMLDRYLNDAEKYKEKQKLLEQKRLAEKLKRYSHVSDGKKLGSKPNENNNLTGAAGSSTRLAMEEARLKMQNMHLLQVEKYKEKQELLEKQNQAAKSLYLKGNENNSLTAASTSGELSMEEARLKMQERYLRETQRYKEKQELVEQQNQAGKIERSSYVNFRQKF